MDWKRIKAITMDVDGVMTDGSLLAYDSHEMVRVFNAKDSFAIRFALMRGYKVGVFTGGNTEGVLNRFLTCGMDAADVYMGCRGKVDSMNDFCRRHGLSPDELVYLGDDIPDVPVLKAVGIGAVPADASQDAKDACNYVCTLGGGQGCVREVIEALMREQGTWTLGPDEYAILF